MTDTHQIPELFNVLDAAKAMRCSKQKIYKLLEDGDIPSFKLNGKIVMRAEAVREWIKKAEEKAISGDLARSEESTLPSEGVEPIETAAFSTLKQRHKLKELSRT